MTVVNAYSDRGKRWEIVFEGQTPEALTLVDFSIEYAGTDDPLEDPLYLPKFTFTFLGKKELYDAFGTITWNSHPFTITGDSEDEANPYTFKGYLVPDVFSMPNTGFREEFELNGISEVEALKYVPYASISSMVNLWATVEDILTENTGVFSVTPPAGQVKYMHVNDASLSMTDDKEKKISMLKVLEWICALGWRLMLNWDNTVTVYYLPHLFSVGGNDYSEVKHAGVDETFETGEVYESVSVSIEETRPEIANIDLKLPSQIADMGMHTVHVQLPRRSGHHSDPYRTYDRFCGYFKKGQFDGWEFPKYRGTSEETDWDNPDKIFGMNGEPICGAYPSVTRQRNYDDWRKTLLVVCYYNKEQCPFSAPYAIYKKSFIPRKGDFLNIKGSVIHSFFAYCDSKYNPGWPILYGPQGEGYHVNWDGNETWEQCPVPVGLRAGADGDTFSWERRKMYYWMYISVRFGDRYWNPTAGDWTGTTEQKFELLTIEDNGEGNDNAFQVPKEIVKKIDAFSEAKTDAFFKDAEGYWLELPNSFGELEIRFYFPFRKTGAFSYRQVMMVENLTVSKINIYDDSEYVNREDVVYEAKRDETAATPESEKKEYTLYFSSYRDDTFEVFLSTLYYDAAGTEPVLDDTEFLYPYPQGGGSLTKYERPEKHIARIALYYISKLKKITDMLYLKDRKATYSYRGDKLWENGCNISPLTDTVEITYCYNRTSYDS